MMKNINFMFICLLVLYRLQIWFTRVRRHHLYIVLAGTLFVSPVFAVQSNIVSTIKPIHSLVVAVMGDTGTSHLLIEDIVSPHTYSMKPSQYKILRDAEVVFYIDTGFESFMHKALADLPPSVRKVPLVHSNGVSLLSFRKSGVWQVHEHEDAHGHEHGHHHEYSDHDPHFWLDPRNAIAITKEVVKVLSEMYPRNSEAYQRNAATQIAKLEMLDMELVKSLSAVKHKAFIVFHDAYQYLERRYSLSSVGSIIMEPGQGVSVKRIQEIRKKLQDTNTVCAFREPQFDDKLLHTVIEGTQIKIGTLDPLGIDLQPGASLYPQLMRHLVTNLAECLR